MGPAKSVCVSAARGQAQRSSWDTCPVHGAAAGSLPLPLPTGRGWQWERVPPAARPLYPFKPFPAWMGEALGGCCSEQSCLFH